MIIQCPKCQTKFSVSSELISELELPRFHCSRCDNVFDMDPRTPASFEDADIDNSFAGFDPNDSTRTEMEDPIGAVIDSQLDEKDSNDSNTDEYSEKSNSSTRELSSDDLKIVTSSINSERDKTSKSLEIPKIYSPAAPISAPIESIEEDDFLDATTEHRFDNPQTDRQKTEQLSMDLKSDPLPERENELSMPYGISYGDPLDKTTDAEPVIERVPAFEESSAAILGRSSAASFGIFLMPIIAALILASLLSLYLIKSPSLAEALAGNIGVSMPQFPPAAMYIEDVRFSGMPLDNGEVIYTLSGKIKNNSAKKYKNVILEGFAFDKSGKEIGTVKSSAGNGLSNTRIKSLNIEMIKSMQGIKAPKRYELNPNSSQDFTLVLNGTGLGFAEFFSARIHSVVE